MVRPGQHRQGSSISWSSSLSYLSTGHTGGMAEGAARETRVAHMCSCSCASCCPPLQSALSEDQTLIQPILLAPGVSGGEYRQNKSCITQGLQFCWGEIFMAEYFEAPLFCKEKKKSTVHILHPREDCRRSSTLSVPSSRSGLTSLQQWKLTIAVAHSPFSYLIGTLIILK